MASQLEIANWALTLIGEKRLSSLSDDNQNAEIISELWNNVRDSLLTSSAWSFAIERTSLPADSDVPAWGYSYQFTLPDYVVRVLQVSEEYSGLDLSSFRNGDTNLYRIEKRKILANMTAPIYVRWITNNVDVGLWHVAFAKLMAADLAFFLNPRATENEQISMRIAQWRVSAWADATAANAIEQPSEPVADSEWMASHAA